MSINERHSESDRCLRLATLCFLLGMKANDIDTARRMRQKHRRYMHLHKQAMARGK